MRPSDQHALARSIRKLAIGVVRDVDARQAGKAANSFSEREEQYQIAISGTATDYPLWTTAVLPFETAFTIATGNRESSLQRPQVAVGFELTAVQRQNDALEWEPVTAGVLVTAVVRDYAFDDAHAIKSATVLIGATAPGDELRFSGFVHITFQGLGAPRESQPDEAG